MHCNFCKIILIWSINSSEIQKRNGTTFGALVECELNPYSINKFRTNEFSGLKCELFTYYLEDVSVNTTDVSESQNSELKTLLNKYGHVFATDDSIPGRTLLVEHYIDLNVGTCSFKL